MERFSRTEKLLGTDKLKKLQESSVLIAGAGAVGSFAAEALVRSGIGGLTIIDFDKISTSNINRQLFALDSTVGQLKTRVAAKRLKDINPDCRLLTKNIFINKEVIPDILKDCPKLVIDAIDSVGPKIELLAYCHKNNIPVISSMGAARRKDPTAVNVGDLFETANCPLARILRKALRRRGINSGICCVYSKELPERPNTLDFEDISASGRTEKKLGSLPTVTGVFGLMLADASIKFLINNQIFSK